MSLLRRFCLYGFLKNQQYYEPFLILFFLKHGLSFAAIGLLIAFREGSVALMEIPSGAVADVFGRRKSMVLSFSAYIVSFLIFYLSSEFLFFMLAMFSFSIGEAFRTGTHKAMIFAWLKNEGRDDQKTSVYGQTRSWSKFGSALSLPLAVVLVFTTGEYAVLFLASALPYMLNTFNILSYPKWLDKEAPSHNTSHNREQTEDSKGRSNPNFSLITVFRALRSSILEAFRLPPLREILIESMCFEGLFKTAKDYIQPILVALIVSVSLFPEMERTRQVAILTGCVYFILYILSGLAATQAGRFRDKTGGDESSATRLWRLDLVVFIVIGIGMSSGATWIVVVAFMGLAILQNLWRPLLVSRCATHCRENRMATLLSIESQAKSLFTCLFAPLVGWGVDSLTARNGEIRFLPVSLLGIFVSLVIIVSRKSTPKP